MNFQDLILEQRTFFAKGTTRSVAFRISMLQKLQHALQANEILFENAMKQDMNKSSSEVYMTELGMVLEELRFHIKHLPKWSKAKRVPTPLAQFPGKSYITKVPYGVALIMSPWNYPIQLCLSPLIGAISAGCTAIVKPSNYAPETSRVLAKILGALYPKNYIAVVEGGREQNAALLKEKYDYIFFTGSPIVGKLVMESAAKHLTPITLELGGKSPVIVHKDANIKIAARRIAFGKVLNAGQTCVAPDYLLIQKDCKASFVKAYQAALQEFFPDGDMSDMNVIINEKHFERISGLLKSGEIILGGGVDANRRHIEPTLLDQVKMDSPIMREEIFGPVLPMITYTSLSECISIITSQPKPLALYLFTKDKSVEKKILEQCTFGGGCINDTIIHLANSHLGFGGVGESGMGNYHGRKSFDTFTHERSIVNKATWMDLPIRYRPYTQIKNKLLRIFLK